MPTPDQAASPFRAAGALPVDRRFGGRIAATDQLPVHALGDQYVVDGNGTVTSLPALPIGETVFLQVTGTPTFVNSAKLLCPNGVNYTATTGDLVIARSGGDGIWRLYVENAKKSRYDFAGINDNATDNKATLDVAIASPYERIYLPEGTYYTTDTFAQLGNKHFYGPGKIRDAAGDWMPGRFVHFTSTPTPSSGSTLPTAWQGDNSKVEPEYFYYDAGVRVSLTEQYFEFSTIPHPRYMDDSSGHSGTTCALTAAITAPAAGVSIAVTGTGGVTVGTVLAFMNPSTGNVMEQRTVASIPTTTSITFTTAVTGTYASGYQLSVAKRTHASIEYNQVTTKGGGDRYSHTHRLSGAYVATSGQNHFFYTATTGVLDGDANAGANYNYFQTTEFQFLDNGYDIAVIDHVRTFNRTNATGGLGCVWLGRLNNSSGTQPIDADIVLQGKAKVGLEYTNANFGAGQCAINLANGHRVYWGSTGSPDVLGNSYYSGLFSATYLYADNSATPRTFGVNMNGVNQLVVQPNAIYSNGSFNATTKLTAAGFDSSYITSNSTRVTIDPTASKTATQGELAVMQKADGAGNGLQVFNTANTHVLGWLVGADLNIYLAYDAATIGKFTSATGAYTALSDRTLKKSIAAFDRDAWDIVKRAEPVSYLMKSQGDDERRNLGFIAQDLAELVPEAVATFETDDADPVHGLEYTSLIPVLWRALQQAQGRIEALEKSQN